MKNNKNYIKGKKIAFKVTAGLLLKNNQAKYIKNKIFNNKNTKIICFKNEFKIKINKKEIYIKLLLKKEEIRKIKKYNTNLIKINNFFYKNNLIKVKLEIIKNKLEYKKKNKNEINLN
ncbi:MAG: hypothetical protein AAYR31_00355 [Candidatus Vidania fulgoroideorum]